MPGQYKHLAPAFANDPSNDVRFITKENKPDLANVGKVTYKLARQASQNIHQYLRRLDDQILHGQAVVRATMQLKQEGFEPDIICAHSGWGEALFLRDAFVNSRILTYCEFFYASRNSDSDFHPNAKRDIDKDCRTRMHNAHMLTSLLAADWGISPTQWQRDRHPEPLRSKISVVHDGIDTDLCQRNPKAQIQLANGRVLSAEDEVITYVARNLEPYRGFDVYMRAVEEVCRRRPNAHFVIVGGDDTSYGDGPVEDENWRENLLRQVKIDPSRVHFMGKVPYDTFRDVLSISSAHVYLTYPFVLSWSMLEAMSHGCLMITSKTAPVTEVIEHGRNGLMVDFFDHKAIADQLEAVLARPEEYQGLRAAARDFAVRNYDLRRVCLPAQIDLVHKVLAGELTTRGSNAGH